MNPRASGLSRGAILDEARCEALMARAAAGDKAAAQALIAELWHLWVRLAGASRALRGLPARDEAARDIATRLAEKIGGPGARGPIMYGSWKEKNPEKIFGDWIRIVTANAARDHARGTMSLMMQAAPDRGEGEVSRARLLNEFFLSIPADDVGHRPSITPALMAAQVLAFAREHLPEEQLAVLGRWLRGESFDEIAAGQGLDAAAAQRSLRAGVAVLRRRFGGERG